MSAILFVQNSRRTQVVESYEAKYPVPVENLVQSNKSLHLLKSESLTFKFGRDASNEHKAKGADNFSSENREPLHLNVEFTHAVQEEDYP
jgi:hypothetical protein